GILFIFRGLGLGIPYLSPSNISLFVQSSPNCH
ncbi:MAG TPA: sulfite exporter TauE/SafE family protein, partial [Flavobacterium alvei]|nr:sulfite exporter TauE/SafE family protein [Flavobacterium alvei]